MKKIKSYLSKPMSRGDYLNMFIVMLLMSVGYLAWFMKKLGVNLFGKSKETEEEDEEVEDFFNDEDDDFVYSYDKEDTP